MERGGSGREGASLASAPLKEPRRSCAERARSWRIYIQTPFSSFHRSACLSFHHSSAQASYFTSLHSASHDITSLRQNPTARKKKKTSGHNEREIDNNILLLLRPQGQGLPKALRDAGPPRSAGSPLACDRGRVRAAAVDILQRDTEAGADPAARLRTSPSLSSPPRRPPR